MNVDNETVKRIAFLSRLNVDNKLEDCKREFGNILGLIEKFDEVNVAQVKPLISVNENDIMCREDAVTEGGNAKVVLANAPAQEFGYFVVPKVME